MGALWLPLLYFSAAAEEPDSVVTTLKEVVVEANGGKTVRISAGGNMRVDTRSLRRGMRSLGEADIIAALKRSPGVSSVGDYGSGVVIEGNSASQALFRIDGAPVFFPYRFGGVFSTFNTTHFSAVTVLRSNRTAAEPSRLGAVIDLMPAFDFSRPVSTSVNVGLLASTITLKTSLANKFALTASGRISYVDQVYGHWLDSGENSLSYRFSDLNVSAAWKINDLNNLSVNFFRNTDALKAGNGNYGMDTRLRWTNNLASARWTNTGSRRAEATVYFSEFNSRFDIEFPQFLLQAPGGIKSFGAYGRTLLVQAAGLIPEVNVGGDASCYEVTPIYARLTGETAYDMPDKMVQRAYELRLFCDATFRPVSGLKFTVGVSGSTFRFRNYAIDPRASVDFRFRENTFTLGVGCFTQYLHQVGFSEIGLASNFWYATDAQIAPQRSVDLSLGWSRSLFDKEYTIAASAYFKRVYSQSEYDGRVLDLLSTDYTAGRNIITANGYNAGVEVSVQKNYGDFTGTAGASFGTAMRKLPGTDYWFHSLTDAGIRVNADVEYMINSHWSVSAAFVFASGRVYTPTRYLYLIANRLITEDGDRNSARLPNYQRLDLSGTYRFRTGGEFPLSHMVNISFINAYGHRNVENQMFVIDAETLKYRLSHGYSMYRFLPSLSYSIEF